MRTLYFCRHAKSSWADPGQKDIDRPLNERGQRNAPFMAGLFRERGEPVQLLVSSPANRAISTARFFSAELGAREVGSIEPDGPFPQLVQEKALYDASAKTILHVINTLPGSLEQVMLFGHNPGFTELVELLGSETIGNLPTCGLARIDLPIDTWQAASHGLGTLVWIDAPKRHPGQD